MIDAETYIGTVVDWLRFWDAKVYVDRVGPQPATVGHLYDLTVAADGGGRHTEQVHFCVAMISLSSVDSPFVVHDFTRHVNAHAHETSRGTPGSGTIEVAIAGIISPLVHATAATAATVAPASSVAGVDLPVVVDLSTGQVHTYGRPRGTAGLAAPRKVRQLFRPPAELRPPPGHDPAH